MPPVKSNSEKTKKGHSSQRRMNPKLIRPCDLKNKQADKQCPSAFLAEMSLTTEERLNQTYEMHVPEIIELLDMSEMTLQKNTIVSIEEPLFQPFPSEIIFQNFEPQQTYRVLLQLRNNDQVGRLIKVIQAETPYFQIISPLDVGHKVAPGMDTVFHVQFTPDQKKDYNHEIICVTEREKFLIPVKAIGARGILDFPDEIHFGLQPVKYKSSKLLLVRNIGNTECKFNLLTGPPYSVSPDVGVLAMGNSIQVEVFFDPQQTGGFTSHMLVQYDTGEEIYVGLHGDASDINVRLDKNTIRLDNTYLNNVSRRSVQISNRSDVLVRFSWKSFATIMEEEQQKHLYYRDLQFKGSAETDFFLDECISDPLMRDKFSLVSRSIKNKVKVTEDDKQLYSDENIIIDPLEGEIWPGLAIDVNIMFKPNEAGSYCRTAYCDLTGRETRLPLRIKGDGIGPKIQFSFDTLDVESVFVGSQHSYEVVIVNQGDIDAVFSYDPSTTLFGGHFSFLPTEGILPPGEFQAVQIYFSSSHLGQFMETFYWNVEGSEEKFKFKIRGCVIGPTFHFDVPHVKFAAVSYGFTYQQTCKLVNTSLIPMSFNLHVPTDGHHLYASAVTKRFLNCELTTSDVYKQIKTKPIEFEISPSHGVLMPLSDIDIQVNFTPLACGKYDVVLMVDVQGIGKDILSLPISAKCIVPIIDVSPVVLDYGRCFLSHPYKRVVLLHNDTDLPAKYELITKDDADGSDIIYSSPIPRGVINAKSVLEIPLHVTVLALQQTELSVCFSIYGSKHEFLQVQVKAIGEGPVVHLNERAIDFGKVPVLTDMTRCITLKNESLIPAEFFCEMVRSNSLYAVEPVSAVIPAEKDILLNIKVNVNDNVSFKDKLQIHIKGSVTHTVHLSAIGIGTTIVTESAFGPEFDLGPQFSCRKLQKKLRFHNRGRRPQQLYWFTEGFRGVTSKRKKEYNPDDMKYKNMPPPPDPPKPVFKLIPDHFSLSPGKYQDVILEGFSENAKVVKERLNCQAIVGNVMVKEKIMVVDIAAEFIQPLLEFTETSLHFVLIKQPDVILSKETKQITVKNITLLPLHVVFKIAYPFQILRETSTGNVLETNELELTVNVAQETTLSIVFDPHFVKDSYSRSAESILEVNYKDHPNQDSFRLKGDVFYPNLEFETMQVNFDSILNDTEHLKSVKVTNNSPLDVYYTWTFIQQDIVFDIKDIDEGIGKDISDGSDEEKDTMFSISNMMTHQSAAYFNSSTERPKTSQHYSTEIAKDRPSTAPATRSCVKKKQKVSAVSWNQLKVPPLNVGIEEVFDILPLYGCLRPSESQLFQFSFYGHSHIMAEATAVCSVRGGPDYKINLTGQASLIKYMISVKDIDFGRQLYDHVNSSELHLTNTGKVSFDFSTFDADDDKILTPGVINVTPSQGVVNPGSNTILTIKYKAGIPEEFKKHFQLRIAHCEPETISISGIGAFPRIVLNLPKDLESPKYQALCCEAKQKLTASLSEISTQDGNAIEPFQWDIDEEIERAEVKQFVLDMNMNKLKSEHSPSSKSRKKTLQRPVLTSYVLDFGPVVLGTVATESCQLTNAGYFPVSFYVDHRSLHGTGFYVDLDRVQGLPGFPQNESLDFQVVFNPLAANLSLGPVEVSLPIKLKNGPEVAVILKAWVTIPDISISTDMIEFNDVMCGQCKVVTIQIENVTRVRCDWEHEAQDSSEKLDKHIPMYLRKKYNQRVLKPKIFEIMPPNGSLIPGQKINVQVKFMPTEETSYHERLALKISQSSEKHFVSCRGQGKEPHIEFDQTVLHFGPILPHSGRDEANVKVTNPCGVPIEFYSLEFDKQYLQEEQILRTLKGYDEYNTLLLPPRKPGDQLPKEILDHCDGVQKRSHSTTNVSTNEAPVSNSFVEEPDTQISVKTSLLNDNDESITKIISRKPSVEDTGSVGDLEITPVSAAIATYLGIDLTHEGRAARNRRGICIIVNGAYLSGKTATAKALAEKYRTPVLTIDGIILDALVNGQSSPANRTRELCIAAAKLAKVNAELESHKEKQERHESDISAPGVNTTPFSGFNKLATQTRKANVNTSKSTKQAHQAVQSPTVSHVAEFVSKKIDVGGDVEYYTCVLPDDLLVELLADRLQISDCHYGVVFDGLDTMFASSLTAAAIILLRAINNRKYIYVVTLKFDFDTLKEVNATKAAEKEKSRLTEEQNEWLRLEEMSEGEYDSLPAEEKKSIDKKRLKAKKERLRIKKEDKLQRERVNREKELLEEKLREDERNKKGRKSTIPLSSTNKVKERKSTEKLAPIKETNVTKLATTQEQVVRPETSLTSDKSGSIEDSSEKKPKARTARTKSGMLKECHQPSPCEDLKDTEPNEDRILRLKFQPFEHASTELLNLFDNWNRTTGTFSSPESVKTETEMEVPLVQTSSCSRRSDKKNKGKLKDVRETPESPALSQGSTDNTVATSLEENPEALGIPNVILQSHLPGQSALEKVLEAEVLPETLDVMNGIGIGPSGPPIPPATLFSVIPFPVLREAPLINEFGQHYTFMSTDTYLPELLEKTDVIDLEKSTEKKDSKKSKKNNDRQLFENTKKARQFSMSKPDSPPLSPEKDGVLIYDKSSKLSVDLLKHRWVIQPGETIDLRIAFTSQDLGQFDQTLTFELVTTRRKYQLYCRGVCSFPNLSREPRIVFPSRKKFRKPDEIVHKKFILNSETFEFGPLLAGKNRERYREGRFPENMERFCMTNTSPMDAEVSFAFLNDQNATTFILEPSTLTLKPGESKNLFVWAYPKTPGFYEDVIVCCIKDNPEPVTFKISTHGVQPELELDRKIIQFDRVLLHRKESKTIYLRNSSLLPVSWRLSGIENLGDDFSVGSDHGIIEPMNEYGLQMHFRALKPVTVKKIVRLEVSDADNVMGLAHAENISVQAEAYDIALDMSFPKGADGGLEFGVIKVGEEVKQSCALKNKGRYEIAYHFAFEDKVETDFGVPLTSLADLFTITPAKGSLIPSDRPTQIQFLLKPKEEVAIKDAPILKCQIIEPSLGEEGEVIASIPIKLSLRSVYSKYSIYPINDINFGAVLVNAKKTRTFAIENKGDFDFRYFISKAAFILPQPTLKLKPVAQLFRASSRQGSLHSGKSQIMQQRSRRESMRGNEITGGGVNIGGVGGGGGGAHNSARLNIGMFTVLPTSGLVLAGGTATITVDMLSEIAMIGEEEFLIDISERSPSDHPNGIEYRLYAEACSPSILSLPAGFSSIFEEHRIVKNLNVFRCHTQDLPPGTGVYGEDEGGFTFYNVIVGHKAEARFKITNSNKVSADVSINLKPISNKQVHRIADVYDVQPNKAAIPPHSSMFATVTFQPPSMQSYSCIFEALVEGLPHALAKGRNLTFEIQGDGNLPRITVLKPMTQTTKGVPILVFSKISLKQSLILPLLLKNDGTLPCDVVIKLTDPNHCFAVTEKVSKALESDDYDNEITDFISLSTTSSKPVSTTLHLAIGEVIEFIVECSPSAVGRMAAELRLSVINNPFEDTTVQLIGEGYQDEVTIGNIQSPFDFSPSVQEERYDGDNIIVPSSNQLLFGDCMINVPKTLHFTIFNQSKADTIRFFWEQHAGLMFKPNCGHLQANCAKDISVTFLSPEPCKLEKLKTPCKVAKIALTKNKKNVYNWDDTKKIVRWVDAGPLPTEDKTTIGPLTSDNSTNQGDKQSQYCSKKKIIEIEEEPPCIILPDSHMEIDLLSTANCDYAKYSCKTDRIYFKDTYIFETRIFSFTFKNTGETGIDFSWDIQAGLYHPPSPVVVESAKSSKSRRSGVMPSLKSQSPISRNSGVKSKSTDKKSSSAVPSEPETPDPAELLRSSSQMGYSADGRPASVMTLLYETAGANGIVYLPGNHDLPFTVEPQCGTLLVDEEAVFTVRYSPLEVNEFHAVLTANIENLEPSLEKPIIALYGKSLLPWCHFDLTESTYIKDRRNPELRGPDGTLGGNQLDGNTKTLEFEACGAATTVVRKFFVLNPTNTVYSFQWIQNSSDFVDRNLFTNFVCRKPKGTICPGKKFEMKFEYIVESLDVCESFWRFVLTEHNVSVPFLLVGFGSEPALSFDRSHINFKQLLIGHTGKQVIYLLNEEKDNFSFRFEESSRFAAGHIESLMVEPMKGVVAGNDKLPITIFYRPETEAEVNFNLKCLIKQKNSALTLNVKAQGFAVDLNLICEDSNGNKVTLSPKGMNIISFGNVELNEKSVRQLFLENNGQFNLDFAWVLIPPPKPKENKNAWNDDNLPVTVGPETGTITPGSKKRCQIAFAPPVKMHLKKCMLALKIANGPTYDISITGSGCPPALQFSFLTYDFGPCFIYRSGLPVQKKLLHILNADDKDISLECLYVNTSHLEVHSVPGVIRPGEKVDLEMRFYPREKVSYKERIIFEVNGLSLVNVDVLGEGTAMKVEVVDSCDKKINLGLVKMNEKTKKIVPIVNNSLAPIDFTIACTPFMALLQNPGVLSVVPNTLISLKPKQCCDVVVQFYPTTRIPKFTEEIVLECAGASQPLFNITAACQGLEIKLGCDSIPFGSVTLGSSSSRKLTMINTGDIGTKFEWNIDAFRPSFSISPFKGYISPGMEVPFDIDFTPEVVCQDIRCDNLKCSFESGQPLRLILTGSCIAPMPMKELLHFVTHVRNRDTKNVAINNKTNQLWSLKPVIDGEYWSGAETLIVEPQQNKNYELCYRPLTMTQDQKKHTGSVFFALPDGCGLLYNLLGTADPPKPIANIQREVPCKISYVELLNVSNWLRKPQRFRVLIEVVKPEKPDPATTLTGLDYIDVPGLSKKEYKIQFFAHKEGTFSCKVTFKNEQSGEYQFYYVTFKVGNANSLGTIDLTTSARQCVSHVVTLHNPLTSMVNFQTSCNISDVNLPPMFTIPPQTEGSCTFEYLPLKIGNLTGRLTLNSLELGAYIYDLNLTATPAAPERAVNFITTLGANQTQGCKFTSYARTRAEYSCKVDSTEFTVDKSVNAASAASGGSEVSIDVTFEPSRLGDCQGVLTLVSQIGGEYVIPLLGHCLPPKPQGPFTIKAGGYTQIPFKNIFAQTTSYTFHIDNPSFNVRPGETIRAKKTHNLVVSYDGNQGDSKVVRMARLVITCARSAGTGGNLSWTFYLKGVTP